MPVAETVAVVASIIAIIQISDRIISSCKFYIEAASETPSELRTILIEISALRAILDSVRFLQSYDSCVPTFLEPLLGKDGSIEECRRLLLDLDALFPKDDLRSGLSAPPTKRVKLIRASLAWPLKAHRARGLLRAVLQQKANINLALTIETSQDVRIVKNDTKYMRSILTDSQHRDVYKWLETTDPSPNHNRAKKLHEQRTCDWVLRSSEWMQWLNEDLRCLWVHGIPGAGKTILTSHLVQQIENHCNGRVQSGYSYYYCYFGRNQDEAAPFLRWCVAQLCRQAEFMPEVIFQLFKRGKQPDLSELLNALEAVLAQFTIAYIILDAVDESKPRSDLLGVLANLSTEARFSKVRWLATSRKYEEIEQRLGPVSRSLPMSNAIVDEDIRQHVHAVLQNDCTFQRWPSDLIFETEEALVQGSQGIALATLPKTLEDTYERIFEDIPEEDWPFVRHTLQWICFHEELYKNSSPLALQILLDATELSVSLEGDSQDDIRYDSERLKTTLGCLVHVDQNHSVLLAHYTVKEYFRSPRVTMSKTDNFKSGNDSLSNRRLMQIIFERALALDWDDGGLDDLSELAPRTKDTPMAFLKDFSVYCVAASVMLLGSRQASLASDERLLLLAIEFVDPSRDGFDAMAYVANSLESFCSFFSNRSENLAMAWQFPSWSEESINPNAAILLHFLLVTECSGNPALANTYTRDRDIGTIAGSHLAFDMQLEDYEPGMMSARYMVEGTLLEVAAQLSLQFATSFKWIVDHFELPETASFLLATAAYHSNDHNEAICPLRKVLARHANPNADEYVVTALQISVAQGDVAGVEELLEAGADPNATGNATGCRFGDLHVLRWSNALHGLRPLQICRDERHMMHQIGTELRESLENLLLKYGAFDS